MGAIYVMMLCEGCGRRQKRYVNSRLCSCRGTLRRCTDKRAKNSPLSFQAATGAAVRKIRLAAGLSATELCSLSGLSKAFVSDVETGKRGISLEHFLDITFALQTTPTRLLSAIRKSMK